MTEPLTEWNIRWSTCRGLRTSPFRNRDILAGVETVYLVRHAKAGERREWRGEDIDRPISKKGQRQSTRLAERLLRVNPSVLLSSEYVRCQQTLIPLAELCGLQVEVAVELTEHQPVEPALELLRTVPDKAVLCSHGDIIPAVISAVKKSGASLPKGHDWRKASTWVLTRNKRGEIVSAKVWPPPIH